MSQIERRSQEDIEKDKKDFPFPEIQLKDVQDAYERIKQYIHRTPIFTGEYFDEQSGRQVFFKCENLQKIGAFKFRGACNAIFQLSEKAAEKGVVTHSSGNHAQALSLAAKKRGIPAFIVMPTSAPIVKKKATLGYGAQVIDCEPTLQARETTAERVVTETGATFIHPYNNLHIIAGQGTIAIELLEQVPELDAIIVPVGGGGLLSGITVAAKALNPKIKIIAAEPQGANDAYRSFKSGVFVPQTAPNTIADGLLTSLGTFTWPIIRDLVDYVITVTEEEIRNALKDVFLRLKLVIEPSAAVSTAVCMSKEFKEIRKDLKRVAVILCGGNIDIENFKW